MLDSLTKADITELKAFANPPVDVKVCLQGVAIMLGIADLEWPSIKKMLADINFLKHLANYNKDNVDPALLRKVKPIVTKENMTYENLCKKSKAVAGIGLWLQTLYKYATLKNKK